MPIPSSLPWMRIHMYYSCVSERGAENVLWFRSPDPLDGGFDAKANAAAVIAAIRPTFLATMSEQWKFEGAKVAVNNTVYTTVNDVISGALGDIAGTSVPAETTVIVQAQCEVSGPSGKGRLMLPGCAEENTVTSRLAPSGVTLYNAVATLLNAPIVGDHDSQWFSVIYSRHNNALQPVKFWEIADVLCHRKSRRPRF